MNFLSFLIVVVLGILLFTGEIVASNEHVGPQCNSTNSGSRVFNGCHIDNTKYLIPSALAYQLISWFTFPGVMILCTSVLFVVSGVRPSLDLDGDSSEVNAKVDSFRLQTVFLMYRAAFGVTISYIMKVLIQQDRPCWCVQPYPYSVNNLPGFGTIYIGDSRWGMVSTLTTVATIVGFHFLHKVNMPLGAGLPLLVGAAKFTLGYNSLGQVLAAMALGGIVHIWTMLTPTVFMFLNLVLSTGIGVTAFTVIRVRYPNENMNFTSLFMQSVIWQIFSMLCLIALFEWSFVKSIMGKAAHNLAISDFQYYMPLNQISHRRSSGKQLVGYITLVFILLVSCGVIVDVWVTRKWD